MRRSFRKQEVILSVVFELDWNVETAVSDELLETIWGTFVVRVARFPKPKYGRFFRYRRHARKFVTVVTVVQSKPVFTLNY